MSPEYELPIDSGEVARYIDIATFMRTPRIDDPARVDVPLVGIPFDQGLAYRPGARHAPAAVREASRLIRRVNPTTKVFPFKLAQVADVGDVNVHPYDYEGSLQAITDRFAEMRRHGARPIACGGDHLVTLPILRGLAAEEPVGVIQIDSHSDTLDTFYGKKVTHATMMRRGIEEGLVDPKRCVQIGLRGTLWDGHDFDYAYESGMRVITFDDYEEMGRDAVIEEIRKTVGDGRTYITVDMDGLDPRDAPATAVPEPGGVSMRDLQVIMRSLGGIDAVGADVVEISPPHDPSGITAVNGANVMFELLCVIAPAHAAAKKG